MAPMHTTRSRLCEQILTSRSRNFGKCYQVNMGIARPLLFHGYLANSVRAVTKTRSVGQSSCCDCCNFKAQDYERSRARLALLMHHHESCMNPSTSSPALGEVEGGPKPQAENEDELLAPREESPVLSFPQLETTVMRPDPPPPYRDRRHRHSRPGHHPPDDHFVSSASEADAYRAVSETSPLLGYSTRRERAVSHSSTARSTQSFAHNVISLFQADVPVPEAEEEHFWARVKSYFRPLKQSIYYAALFHLLVLNFPFALAAWIYLFVATFVSIVELPGAVKVVLNINAGRSGPAPCFTDRCSIMLAGCLWRTSLGKSRGTPYSKAFKADSF
jgi:hypothetical protein